MSSSSSTPPSEHELEHELEPENEHEMIADDPFPQITSRGADLLPASQIDPSQLPTAQIGLTPPLTAATTNGGPTSNVMMPMLPDSSGLIPPSPDPQL